MFEALEQLALQIAGLILIMVLLGALALWALRVAERDERIRIIRAHDEYPKPPANTPRGYDEY